ncbi:MAG: hypothetical protein ACIAQF_02230 [Phycisphaerales bacterium JB065]
MSRKPRGEKFGDGLEVAYSPGDLRLVIHPSRGPCRTALRLFLILLPLPLLAIAPVQQAMQVYQHFANNSPGQPAQIDTVIKWAVAFGFAMFLHVAGLIMARKRHAHFSVRPPSRVGKWVSKLTDSVPEDCLHIDLKTGGGQQSYSSERSSYFNLRIQPEEFEQLPHGEHAKIVYGPGDLWLRFETTNYEPFAINLPVDGEHVDRLAAMVGEVFGQECQVMALHPVRKESGFDTASQEIDFQEIRETNEPAGGDRP